MHWEQQMGQQSWLRMTTIRGDAKGMHQEQQMGLSPGSGWHLSKKMLAMMHWGPANGSEVLAQINNYRRRHLRWCSEDNKWVWSPGSGWQWSEEMLKRMHRGQQMGLSPGSGWHLSKKMLEMMHWGPANGSEVLAQVNNYWRRHLTWCSEDNKWVWSPGSG